MEEKLKAEFSAQGSILSKLPLYEKRESQLRMALAVGQALTSKTNLMVEAGTGIGKSFAYLIPLIEWCKSTEAKAVIATGTKVLQNQLVSKDLPFLAEHSDTGFKFEVLYGQENFFCRRRAGAIAQYGLFDDDEQISKLSEISRWAKEESGIFEDYPEPIPAALKQQISRRSEACPRRNCSYYDQCPFYRKRRAAEDADILVVNHHLFFAHLESAGKLLPEFGAAIFDEAHRLEQVASSYFGLHLTSIGLSMLLSRIYNQRRGTGILTKLSDFTKRKSSVTALVEETRQASNMFFTNLAGILGTYEYKKRIRTPDCVSNDLAKPLTDLGNFCFETAKDVDEEDLSFELISLGDRVRVALNAVVGFLEMNDPNAVYWIEAAQKSDRISIHSALIDVARHLEDSLWTQDWVNILTSATLTVGKSFGFTSERIGFRGKALRLGSPFDYEHNAVCYIAHDLPPPQQKNWMDRMPARVQELIDASDGRALVLFTSYATLNKTVELLEEKLSKKHTVLVQGRMTRNQLLEEFKDDTSSVLFATQSFWEGVDIPGEALVLLIITRLPFEVPDDPRSEAILEEYRKQAQEPFTAYQLPVSVLRFRQGIGRLIRRDSDYGVIAVLDSRIVKKAYGRLFMESLPPAPVTFNLFEVKNFFENH
ncbi:ATP-dependent DNA helicase [candidate division WOR-3 bacterium]|nr:ATP-dependent DNA helicase [candidate division WOR-3 bacterium]